jgi:hypothetical protein
MSAAIHEQTELHTLLNRSGSHLKAFGFVTLWKPYDRSTRTPAHAYTVGLAKKFRRPELLLFGQTHEASLVTVRTLVARYVRRGVAPPMDEPIRNVLEGVALMVKPVRLERAAKYMRLAVEYCQSVPVPCAVQQVVMPDFAGRYPWDADYDTSFDRYQLRLHALLRDKSA